MNPSHSERGAILVHTAFAMLALMLFSAFVIDYGEFWVSRNQAQNAADAAALAGAQARIYNDTTNPPASKTSGTVYDTVATTASWNHVWGTAPTSTVDWTCPDDGTTNCVAVRTFRDGSNGSSALPTFFLELAGITSQKTTGYAVAKLTRANAITCIKPWIVPDRFSGPDWPKGSFDPSKDTYVDPSLPGSTGYGTQDLGDSITLRSDTSTPSFYQSLSLAGADPGFNGYLAMISGCTTGIYEVGAPGADCLDPSTDAGPFNCVTTKPGNGSVKHFDDTVSAIIDEDPNATVSGTNVVGSCAPSGCDCGACANGQNGTISPRIVPIVLGDPEDIREGRTQIRIVNIFTFFLLEPNGGDLQGVLVKTGGFQESGAGGGSVNAANSFLQDVELIR